MNPTEDKTIIELLQQIEDKIISNSNICEIEDDLRVLEVLLQSMLKEEWEKVK